MVYFSKKTSTEFHCQFRSDRNRDNVKNNPPTQAISLTHLADNN